MELNENMSDNEGNVVNMKREEGRKSLKRLMMWAARNHHLIDNIIYDIDNVICDIYGVIPSEKTEKIDPP